MLEGTFRFGAIAFGLTPSSTPRRTRRFGQSNMIANWKTSSHSRVSWRRRSRPQLKATLLREQGSKFGGNPTQDLQPPDLYVRARAALRGEGAVISLRIGTSRSLFSTGRSLATRSSLSPIACWNRWRLRLQIPFWRGSFPQASRGRERCGGDSAAARATSRRSASCSCSILLSWLEGLPPGAAGTIEAPFFRAPHEVDFFTLASQIERRLGQFAASIRDGERSG